MSFSESAVPVAQVNVGHECVCVCVCHLLHLCMSADDHLTKWQSTFLCKSVFESHADSTSECFPAPQGDVK